MYYRTNDLLYISHLHMYVCSCIEYVCVIVDIKDDTVPSNKNGITSSASDQFSAAITGGMVIIELQKVVLNLMLLSL